MRMFNFEIFLRPYSRFAYMGTGSYEQNKKMIIFLSYDGTIFKPGHTI